MKRSPLRRGKPLGRGAGSRKAQRRSDPRYLAAKQVAAQRQGGAPGISLLCAADCGRMACDPHHVFPEQKWPDLLCEPDNIIWLCRLCHAAHETGDPRRRLARYAIRRAEGLATDDRMSAYLDKFYPTEKE